MIAKKTETLTKEKVQLIVVILLFVVWGVSLVLVAFDGNTVAKIVTPMVSVAFGWLFTGKATNG